MRAFLLGFVVAFAAFFTPVAGAQTLPPLESHLQAIVNCEDPAFPPQSPSGQCATLINFVGDGTGNDSRWRCDRPLPQYGPLPIIVNHIQPNNDNNPPGAIGLGATPNSYPATGCTVPSQRVETGGLPNCTFDQKADMFLQINGNRTTLGSNNDLLKTYGAHCIEIGDPTHNGGTWVGGQVTAGAHADGINCNYCRGLHFYGIEIGDWESLPPVANVNDGASGAHGAGGLWYASSLNDTPQDFYDIVCYGCKLVGSFHPGGGTAGTGFSSYGSDSSGMVDSCVAANNPRPPARFDAINPINLRNTFVDRNDATPDDPAVCPLFDGNEPPPPPPPPDTCDAACVAAYEAQIADLETQRAELLNQLSSAQAQIAALQAEVADLEARLSDTEAERDEARAEVSRLSSIIDRGALILAEK